MRPQIHHHHSNMLSVEAALEKILQKFSVLESVSSIISESLGMVISEDIISHINIPPTDNSAMDGYAVISNDVKEATKQKPIFLTVTATLGAGDLPNIAVHSGTAIRIMTGAPIPAGADAVIPFEETTEMERDICNPNKHIGIKTYVQPKTYIRNCGSDVKKKEKILSVGTKITPPVIGVLASLGHTHVPVYRRPVVSIFATGNELIAPGSKLGHGKIYDSNTSGLVAAIKACGAVPNPIGIAKDNEASLTKKIYEALDSDLIISSAGVSKGDYDIVKDVLSAHGDLAFWSVRMRPAKPLAFGVLNKENGGSVPIIGLPGNPVSALVAFQQFCIAAINKMMGRPTKNFNTLEAILDDDIYNHDGRRVYARVKVRWDGSDFKASLTGSQDSNILTSLAIADGLAICPESIKVKLKGDKVTVIMLDWDG